MNVYTIKPSGKQANISTQEKKKTRQVKYPAAELRGI
jgi:hypothetical protein